MFPYISQDILNELNNRFPVMAPQYLEQHDMLMWRGGQRSVVDFLTTLHAEQETAKLGE